MPPMAPWKTVHGLNQMERTFGEGACAFVVPMLCNMGVHVNRQQATDRSLDLDTPTVRSDVQSADKL